VFIKIGYKLIKRFGRLKGVYFLLFVGAGMFFYVAYNARTIYQFAILGVLLIFILNVKSLPKTKNSLPLALCFAVGVFALASIQIYINIYHSGVFSLAPGGGQVYFRGLPLNIYQLRAGLRVNFYETSTVEGEVNAFSYLNQTGQLILAKEGGIYSFADYVQLLLKYPFEMIGMWMRSIIMGLNPISGGGIIFNRNGRFFLTLANYTMIFLLISYGKRTMVDSKNFITVLKSKSFEFKSSLMSLMTILLPAIFIIPGAVEERFTIGFWVLVYGLFSYGIINIKEEIKILKQNKYSLFLYFLFFFIFVGILTELYANNNSDVFLPILHLNWW